VRGLPIWSESLGLQGKADVIEFDRSGNAYPVEYKQAGKAAELQLCAQALCLEEMTGHPVPEGALYLVKERRRIPVCLDAPLRERTFKAIAEVRAMLLSHRLPEAMYDRRCARCSLLDACVPQARTAALRTHMADPYTPRAEADLP